MVEINTELGKILIFEIPEIFNRFSIAFDKSINVGNLDTGYGIPIPFIGYNKYSILGTLTRNRVFDFDPREFVEIYHIKNSHRHGYKDYVKSNDSCKDYTCSNSQESFITLLESHGVYLKDLNENKYLIINV